MAKLGYGFAYRVLDAQYFNLAQRRQRVFVVGCLGGWQRAAAVLFERASLRGDPAPSRQAGENIAGTVGTSSSSGRSYGSRPIDDNLVSHALLAKGHSSHDSTLETYVTHALRADGFDASEDGTGRGTPLVPVANTLCGHGGHLRIDETYVPIGFNARQDPDNWLNRTGPLDVDGCSQAVAFAQNSRSEVREMDIAGAVCGEPGVQQQTYVHFSSATEFLPQSSRIYSETEIAPALQAAGLRMGNRAPQVQSAMEVRRLTPRECERLQGFEDDYTLIEYRGKPAADGPRYKALGNSMARPVMSWIGRRIELVHAIRKVA
jgi:DNA (cytosine-5)-methyltransferase 1